MIMIGKRRGSKTPTKTFFKKTEPIKERSSSAMGNEFYTKMKKKCLENEPHLLATVIKNKSANTAKEELYRFVTKIIERSKK